jgi:hypothetical protein
MLNFSIFSLPSYKIKNPATHMDTLKKITSLLEKNNGYHELLKENEIIKFNLDIDGKEDIKIENLIVELETYFMKNYEIKIKYSYTQNKSKKDSYHIVIKNIHATSKELKIIASNFKKESIYKNNIDNGHLGAKKKWFRLPNQLKESVDGTEHVIIRGEIKDFILHYIQKNSILIKPIMKETVEERIYKEVDVKKNYEYLISDEEILKLLNALPQNYCDDYAPWLKITTILKSLNKHEIWDEYSRKSYKYDVIRNNEIWNGLKESLNINWLVNELNKNEKKNNLIERIKKNTDITKKIPFKNEMIKTRYMNEGIKMDILKKYDTIIIKSTTGTGKSTASASMIKNYMMKNKKCKMISIISRVIMNNQHLETFKKEGIKLTSYLDVKTQINKLDYVVCLNSLTLLQELSLEEIKTKIVYIDEINCLLESLCLNNLITDIKMVNKIFMKLILNCSKLIISDAIINDAMIELIEKRKGEKIMYENEYKKYENIEAVKIWDEMKFLEMLKSQITENKPFFAAFDSCVKATDFYNECIKNNDKDKFLLITSDTKITITNTNDLRNLWVFYSPSVTISLDFNIEVPQNVYMHITGLSVNSSTIFQMSTRTRNIEKLYYYSESKQKLELYEKLEDVEKYYKNINTTSLTLKNLCMSADDEDITIHENTYFKLFCYYVYLNDVYNTNITGHYEKILMNNGFKLIKSNESLTKLSSEVCKTLKTQTQNENIKLIDKYIEEPSEKLEFTNIKSNVEYLGLKPENIKDYQEILINKKLMEKYEILVKWCKKTMEINYELKEKMPDTFIYKKFECSLLKIKHIKDVEDTFNIHILNENFNVMEERKIDFDEKKYDELKLCFRYLKNKPVCVLDLKILYLGMLKSTIGINFFKNQINNKLTIKHNCKIDSEKLNFYLKLHNIKNKDKNNWDTKIYEWFCKKNNIREAIDEYL